jgi:hypothetical protein
MRSTTTGRGACAVLAASLALWACGAKPSPSASPSAAAASPEINTGTTSADQGGPGRTGVPSDEAAAGSAAAGSGLQALVVTVDSKVPSITVSPVDAGSPPPGAKRGTGAWTIRVAASEAPKLKDLKRGDPVTLVCQGDAGGEGGTPDLAACKTVVSITREPAASPLASVSP